jgi:hypothetical protein
VDRLSEDIDLFTDRWDWEGFTLALDVVFEAYRTDGLDVAVPRRAETFARIQVTDPQAGRIATVDLAADFLQWDPVHPFPLDNRAVGCARQPVSQPWDRLLGLLYTVVDRSAEH